MLPFRNGSMNWFIKVMVPDCRWKVGLKLGWGWSHGQQLGSTIFRQTQTCKPKNWPNFLVLKKTRVRGWIFAVNNPSRTIQTPDYLTTLLLHVATTVLDLTCQPTAPVSGRAGLSDPYVSTCECSFQDFAKNLQNVPCIFLYIYLIC